jgi:hypothetical protein
MLASPNDPQLGDALGEVAYTERTPGAATA